MANLSSTRIFGDGTIERSLYVKQRLGVGVGSPDYAVDVFGGYPSNSELNSLLDDNDAVIFPYDAGSFIDLGWAARENGSLTTGSFQINNA